MGDRGVRGEGGRGKEQLWEKKIERPIFRVMAVVFVRDKRGICNLRGNWNIDKGGWNNTREFKIIY